MTDPNQLFDPKLHENTADDEYMYMIKNLKVKTSPNKLGNYYKAGQIIAIQEC